MTLPHLIRYIQNFSFWFVLKKGISTTQRLISAKWKTYINANRCTYPSAFKEISLAKARIGRVSLRKGPRPPRSAILLQLAEKYFAHNFDLLGSGWVKVAYGVSCRGFEGNSYPPFASEGRLSLTHSWWQVESCLCGSSLPASELRWQQDRYPPTCSTTSSLE